MASSSFPAALPLMTFVTMIQGMHDKINRPPDHAGLFTLASEQSGYFTAAQARGYGFDWPLLSHHAATGRFRRLRRGLYRLRDYPASPREEVMAAWLSVGKEKGIVAFETALDVLDLLDIVPPTVHILVSRAKRYLSPMAGVVLHTTTRALGPDDVITQAGLRLTSPVRTILDIAEAGMTVEHVARAVSQAVARGMTTEAALREGAGARGRRAHQLMACVLRED